jgi:hypothetical protein
VPSTSRSERTATGVERSPLPADLVAAVEVDAGRGPEVALGECVCGVRQRLDPADAAPEHERGGDAREDRDAEQQLDEGLRRAPRRAGRAAAALASDACWSGQALRSALT